MEGARFVGQLIAHMPKKEECRSSKSFVFTL